MTGINLSIVVPCYNEEAVLEATTLKLLKIFDRLQTAGKISDASRIYYVDDGSHDRTWELIRNMSASDARVCGIRLSRNVGHQNALLAGLFTAEGDGLISLDADLQDDAAVIDNMIDDHQRGMDIVYGVRDDRQSDTLFKRATAEIFYWFMNLFGVDIVRNHADFRFLSRRAIEALREYPEVNLFLRALIRLVGFPHSVVYYKRGVREAGDSKYPFSKMFSFAIDGITSFSAFPLRLITWTGFLVFLLSLSLSAWVVIVKLTHGSAIPGWASTVLPIYFVGGVQILCTGVLGEYLAKIYIETKRRPRYFVQEKIGR